MTLVGDALMSATAALRINYAMFGNLEPALHAHVFPRYVDEPPATRTAQPWALDWSLAPEYSEALYGDLQRRIGEYLHIAVRS
jgi:diadenosine tetraphosphate (Ap4A) HIT family hydrolase